MDKHEVDNLTMLRIVRALTWSTGTFDFLNSDTGLAVIPSEELVDAKALLAELEPLVCDVDNVLKEC